MDMVYCPGCASGPHEGTSACPVCGAPQAMQPASYARRNPFKLIACCCLWAIGFWFAFLFVAGVLAGAFELERASMLDRTLSGPLLLAAIGLAVALTVSGRLPGTARRPLTP